jgi:hypothetical protein
LAYEIIDDAVRGALADDISKPENNGPQPEGAAKSRNQPFRGNLARAAKADR